MIPANWQSHLCEVCTDQSNMCVCILGRTLLFELRLFLSANLQVITNVCVLIEMLQLIMHLHLFNRYKVVDK